MVDIEEVNKQCKSALEDNGLIYGEKVPVCDSQESGVLRVENLLPPIFLHSANKNSPPRIFTHISVCRKHICNSRDLLSVGSDRQKISVPQWGIKPWSLAMRASVIATTPSRTLYCPPGHIHTHIIFPSLPQPVLQTFVKYLFLLQAFLFIAVCLK